ncbi:cyclic GMP-AMP synthase isoform X3 [Symphalangus syndactylus]|uniref:cyclic GMP-AMP synthase isoform X3 n=1 Tax=Symphalangus syndactylus TaxID=9590 RepID=UPI003007595D
MRRDSEAGATASEVSARSARGAPTDPNESPAAPEAALPKAGKFGPARKSGSRQKKSAPDTQERPPVRATGARAKKAPQRAQDAQPPDATSAPGAEELEPPAAREPALSRAGSRAKKAPQRAQDAQPSDATSAPGAEGLEPPAAREPALSRAGSRAKKAPQRAQDAQPSDATSAPGAEGLEPPAAREPALSRAGSRHQRGARCSPKPRPPPGPGDVPSPGMPVSDPILVQGDAAPGAGKLRAVLEKLKLSRQEICEAAEVVNGVVDHLLRRLQKYDSEFRGVGLLRTGSYYEHVKISAPNEFDVMFKLEVPRIQLEEYSNTGAYYFVKFKRNPKENPLSQFLEGEILSASKMLSKFRKIIKEEINNIKDTDVIMKRKRGGSPAVTLLISEKISVDITLALESKSNSWPPSTQEGLPIKAWLSGKVRTQLRLKPFYLVPKHAKEGNGFQEETWRLSFSHIEKEILNNHGETKTCCENKKVKCCRKDCLKLMKYLLEQLKERFKDKKHLDKFSSYHVKTAFFHVCTENPKDSQWKPKDLGLCFDKCVSHCARLKYIILKENIRYFILIYLTKCKT